jgi:hypothetical protein
MKKAEKIPSCSRERRGGTLDESDVHVKSGGKETRAQKKNMESKAHRREIKK